MEPSKFTPNLQQPAVREIAPEYRSGFDSALDLDFPDWSGQKRAPSTATADDMHRLSEMLLPRITSRPGFDEERLKSRNSVEFIL